MVKNPEQRRRVAESLLGVCGGNADGAREALESAIGGVPPIRVADNHARDAVFALAQTARGHRDEVARNDRHKANASDRGDQERAHEFRRRRDNHAAQAKKLDEAARAIDAALKGE